MGGYDNLTFGATAWGLKLFGPDDVDSFAEVAPQVRALPFSSSGRIAGSIEVFAPMGEEGYDEAMEAAPRIREIAKGHSLSVYACGFNPFVNEDGSENPHLVDRDSGKRKEAIARAHRGLDYAAAVAEPGQGILVGPWHIRHKFFGVQPGDVRELVAVLKGEIAPYAQELDVRAALEPMQQDEGYLPNPGQEAIGVCDRVGSPHVGINGDSKHLAFGRGPRKGEKGLIPNLSRLVDSGHLFVFHGSELDRGEAWGRGELGRQTKEIAGELARSESPISFDIENFVPELYGAVNIAVEHPEDPKRVLCEGARHVRDELSL